MKFIMAKGLADFRQPTIGTLALRASHICSNPTCRCITSGPGSKNSSSIVGEAAHIRGAREGKNNRYDPNMTDEERRDISNGIWLCGKCASLIDRNAERYTVVLLNTWKSQHEEKIAEKLEDGSAVVFDTDLASGLKSIEQKVDLLLPDVAKYQSEIDRINGLIDNDDLIKGKVLAEDLISKINSQTFPEKNVLHAKLLGLTGVAEIRLGESLKAGEAFLASAQLREVGDVKKLSHKALGDFLSGTKDEASLALIDRAIAMDSEDENLKTIKANILLGLGRHEDLEQFLNEIKDVQTRLFFKAHLALHLENYEVAETAIREYLSVKPEDKEGLDFLSTAIVTSSQHFLITNNVSPNKIPQKILDRLNEAKQILEKLLQTPLSDKKKATFLNKRSAIHSICGEKEQAFEDLTTAHSLDPLNPQILLNKGNLLFLKGDLGEALSLFEKLPKDMESFKLNIAKIICLKKVSRVQEAANLLLSLLDPTNPIPDFFPHMRLVVETLFRGQKNTELDALIETLKRDFKDNPYAMWGRAVFEIERGNHQDAADLLKKAAALAPEFVDILISYSDLLTHDLKDHERGVEISKNLWELIGELQYLEREAQGLYHLKRYEELGRVIAEAKQLEIESNVLLELEGFLCLHLKELEKAAACFLNLTFKRPDLSHTLLQYGDCMSRLGRFEEAIRQFDRIKNKIQEADVLFYLSDFYLKQGNWLEALALAKRAKDLSTAEDSYFKYFQIFMRVEQVADQEIDMQYIQTYRDCMTAITNFSPEIQQKYGMQMFRSDQMEEVLPPLLKQQKDHVSKAFELYNQRKRTVFALSKSIGGNNVETFRHLLRNPAQDVYTDLGNQEEKDRASRLLPENSRIALTGDSLCLLGELDCLDLLTTHFEEIVVSQSLADDLHSLRTEDRFLKEKRYLSAYGAGTVSAEEIQREADFFEKLRAFIHEKCTLVGSSLDLVEREKKAVEIIGESNCSIIEWAKGNAVPVLTDDSLLPFVAKGMTFEGLVTTQGLLKFLFDSGRINRPRYDEVLEKMLSLGINYLAFDAQFAIHVLEKSSFKVTDEVKKLFCVLGNMATTSTSSVLIVSSLIRTLWWKGEFWLAFEEFLPLLVNERDPKEYCNSLLDALSKQLGPNSVMRRTVLDRTQEVLRRFCSDF